MKDSPIALLNSEKKPGSVVLEDIEAEGFELGVAFLRRVQVGKNSVASCVAQAGSVSPGEDVLFLHQTRVEEDGEALLV